MKFASFASFASLASLASIFTPSFSRARMLRGVVTAAAAVMLFGLASPAFAQSKIALTITPVAAGKVYGEVDPAFTHSVDTSALTGGDTEASVFSASVLVARVFGDDVGTYEFTIAPATLTTAGAEKYELQLPDSPAVFIITPKEVTYRTTAADKIYDGTPAAPESFGGAFVAGDIVVGDTVYPSGGTYQIVLSPTVLPPGNVGKMITISGVGLSGANAGNYMLSAASRFAGEITRRTVVYTSRAAHKRWDNSVYPPNVDDQKDRPGSGDAPYTSSVHAVYGGGFEPGVIEGDRLCIFGGQFSQSGLGDDAPMTGFMLGSPVGEAFTQVTRSGSMPANVCVADMGDSENYTLSPHSSISGDISRRMISVGQANFVTKEYDGTTTSTQGLSSAGFGGDGVVEDDRQVLLNLGYNSPHVSVTGLPGAELMCLDGASMCEDDDKAAFKINLAIGAPTDGGDDHSGFYTLTDSVWETKRGTDFVGVPAAGCCHVDITPKAVTLSDVEFTKEYDGTGSIVGASVTATVNGVLSGQSFTLRVKDGADAVFADVNVGGSIVINGLGADDLELVSSNALSRVDNYMLPASGITATGTINKRPLCIIANGAGMTAPSGAGLRDTGLMRILTNDFCKGQFASHTLGGAGGIDFTGEMTVETKSGDISELSIGSLALLESAPSNNYALDFRGGQWYYTDSAKTNVLVVTPTGGLTRVYGEAAPAFPFTVVPQSGSAYVAGDGAGTEYFTASPLQVTGSDAGVHAFSLAAAPAYAAGIDTKYDFVVDPAARHVITKRPLNIVAQRFRFFASAALAVAAAQSGDLQFTVQTGAGKIQGYASGEGASEALTGQLGLSSDADAAGNYAITRGTLMATGNYEIASFQSRVVLILAKPETPSITALLKSSSGGQPALEVRWEAGAGGQPVENFAVNYKTTETTAFRSNPRIPNLPATARSHLITSLAPGQSYDVVVIATSAVNTASDNSAIRTAVTHPTPSAPSITSATSGISADITATTIAWTHDATNGAALAFYLQVVEPSVGGSNFPSVDTVGNALPEGAVFAQNAAADGGVLRGLKANTGYSARVIVAAVSGLRSLPSDPPTDFTSTGLPARLENPPGLASVRTGELTASWDAPASDRLGADGARLVRYDLRWRTSAVSADSAATPPVTAADAGDWLPDVDGQMVPGGGLQRQYTITGLAPLVNYDVQVRAASQIGGGTWSRSREFKTIRSSSDADASLASLVLEVADSTVTLMPPFSPAIFAYEHEVERAVTEVMITPTLSSSTSNMNISSTGVVTTPLASGATKTVPLGQDGSLIILNVNSNNGRVALQYVVRVTRLPGAPSQPRSVTAAPGARGGALDVAWQPPAQNNNSDIEHYIVRWKLASDSMYGSGDVQRVEADAPRAHTITGLSTAEYDVQVRAVNGFAEGEFSAAVQATPPANSTDSTLASLSLKVAGGAAIALDPAVFAADTLAYSASVANEVDMVVLAAAATHAGARVTLAVGSNAAEILSAPESDPITLVDGPNTLTITVAAEDASETEYVLTVTRRALSADATLSALVATGSDGMAVMLDSEFTAADETYAGTVENPVSSLTLTATPTVEFSTIALSLNGGAAQALTAGVASAAQELAHGAGNVLVLVVTAQNGVASKTYTLTVTRNTGVPAAPVAPMVADAIESLVVTWAAPSDNGGDNISDYLIRWGKSAPSPIWLNTNADAGQSIGSAVPEFTIPGLDIGESHDVQVAAVNSNGAGAWSAVTPGTPAANAKDADLRGLSVVDLKGVAVPLAEAFDRDTIAYSATVTHDITAVRFIANYNGAKVVIGDPVAENEPDSEVQSDPVNLVIGMENAIPLVVSSSDGSVTKTYTVTITRSAGAPQQIAAPTVQTPDSAHQRLQVNWVWDGSGDNGSDHIGFDVRTRLKAARDQQDNAWQPNDDGVEVRTATDRMVVLTGLVPGGAVYETEVRVVNGIDAGAWSAQTEGRVSGPPDAPMLAALTAGHGSLAASWTALAFTGGDGVAISAYHVRWRTSEIADPATAAGAWQDLAGDSDAGETVTGATAYTIIGLDGGTAYDVEVRALNAFTADNTGAWSDARQAAPTRAALAITPAAATKVYGADDPAFTYTANFITGDDEADVFTATPFERVPGETVGQYNYRLVTPAPFTASHAGKYNAPTLAGGNQLAITKRDVTYVSTAADKVYDGKADAPADLGGSFSSGVVNATVNGVSIDDTATGRLTLSGGAFADKHVGTNKAVTGFVLGGAAVDNYTLASASSVTGDISQLPTTLTATATDRVYNSVAAVGSVSTAFSPDILSGDTVTVDSDSAVYENADAGDAKPITGITTAGADVGNYAITIAGTGKVSKRPLRVTSGGSGLVAPDATALGDLSLLSIASAVQDEGLIGGNMKADVLEGSLALGTRTPSSGPGSAPLTQGGVMLTAAAGKNYALDFTAGDFIFTAPGTQTLILTPDQTTREYGGDDPSEFTYTLELAASFSFIGDDDADSEYFTSNPLSRKDGEDAGGYAFELARTDADGADIAGTYLFQLPGGAQYVITPKEITVGGTLTLSKEYDGNDEVAGAALSGATLNGVVSPESFTLALAGGSDATYADVDVDTGITMNAMTGADLQLISGDDGATSKPANYTLADALTSAGVITAKEVSVTAVVLTKAYDGDADFQGSSVKSGSGVVGGAVSGENFTLTASAGAYDEADAGARTISDAVFALSGDDADSKPANYSLPVSISVSGEITPKTITVGAVTITKTYDNTTSMSTPAPAVLTGGALSDTAPSESFTLQLTSGNDGVYDTADAGASVSITGADFELVGADDASKPANYVLPTLTLTGVITPKPVVVADVVLQKPYDSTDEATPSIATVVGGAVTGAVSPHEFDLTLAESNDIVYAASAVGDDIVLTNADSADFELVVTGGSGGNPANYALPAITVTGSIVPREVDVAEVTLTKAYDGSLAAAVAVVSGGEVSDTVESDVLTLQIISGAYSDVNVSDNLSVSSAVFALQAGGGADAANYALPAQIDVVGVIAPKAASVSTPSLFKNYDGLTAFGDSKVVMVGDLAGDLLAGGVVSDLVGDDSLILAATAGVYDSADVGVDIRISGITWELQAGAAGAPANYALPAAIVALEEIATGVIVSKPITLIATAGTTSKTYDGTTDAPSGLVVGAAAGEILPDDVSEVAFTAGDYDSKNARDASVIAVSFRGSKAVNYTPSNTGIAASITPKSVGVTVVSEGPVTKVYDGTAAAPAGFSITGTFTEDDVLEADRGKVAFGTTGVYDSKDVGDDKIIQVTFIGGDTEDESGNYIGNAAMAVTGASITARPLKITADSVSGLAAEQPDAADLTYAIEQGVEGEGLVGGDTADDVLSGALAYGTADATTGSVPIEQGTLAANANYALAFTAGVFVPSGMLDIDKSGKADGVDGILISRYLLGLRGEVLVANLTLSDGAAGSIANVTAKLDALRAAGTLNVDGNLTTNAADGIIIARYLLGVTSGEALVDGQAESGKAGSVQTTLDALSPPSPPSQ